VSGRIVALDVGERRIGIAVSDPSGLFVRGAGVVAADPAERAIAELGRIVADEQAVLLVIGLPLTLRGEQGPQAKRVLAFAEALKQAVPLPQILRDERYTSVEAKRIIEERGGRRRGKKRRREPAKGEVDELAARLILEDYLSENRRPAINEDY
jgi:putative Holliday junction resolvase